MPKERKAICGFVNSYTFLSNFYIEPDGSHVEGEFQRAKCARAEQRKLFHEFHDDNKPLLSPSMCKSLGQKVELRPDWEDAKVGIMLFYVTKKFKDHPTLADKLRATRGFYLEETNYWNDTYWGVCRGKGQNMLGAILMQVRDEL